LEHHPCNPRTATIETSSSPLTNIRVVCGRGDAVTA
jgi:hypothetical protein